MITHVVLLKMIDRDGPSAATVKDAVLSLRGVVPQIRAMDVGVDVLRSPRSYDVSLIIKFDSLADLQAYQDHPAHQEVLKIITRLRETSITVDYES